MKNSISVCLTACIYLFLGFEARGQKHGESQVHFITHDSTAFDIWPCFSPDGKTILFSRITDMNNRFAELYVVSLSNGAIKRFSKEKVPISATRANWSTSKNSIAFTGVSSDNKGSVWLINANGTKPEKLSIAGLSEEVYYPTWYADGNHLAVMDFLSLQIKRIDIANRKATAITDSSKVFTGKPSVSIDGKCVFAGQLNAGLKYDQTKNSIFIVGESGDAQYLEHESLQGRAPAWSPDGKWVAFESNRDNSAGLYALYLVKSDGSSLRKITPPELDAQHPGWTPDGRKIVFDYINKKTRGIAVIDISN